MIGADVIDTIAKAQATADRAIRRGLADRAIHGLRHWSAEDVTLFLESSPSLTYRELRIVVLGMDYWVQQMPWMYPSIYDVFETSTQTKKAYLTIFTSP